MRGCYKAVATFSEASNPTMMLLEAPSTKVFELLYCSITNEDIDVGEMLAAAITKVTTKGSPVGTSVTPVPTEPGDQASGATVIYNLTTEPTTYNTVHSDRKGFSNLAGYYWSAGSAGRAIYVPPSGLVGLRLINAPSAAHTFNVTMEWREIG